MERCYYPSKDSVPCPSPTLPFGLHLQYKTPGEAIGSGESRGGIFLRGLGTFVFF